MNEDSHGYTVRCLNRVHVAIYEYRYERAYFILYVQEFVAAEIW
jgi:hypothetical protein